MNLWRTEANLRWKLLLLYSYKVKCNILSLFFLKPTF
jgi:hypothetical protein